MKRLYLPQKVEEIFLLEYNRRKKSSNIAWFLGLLFFLHYAYLGEWGIQILYWMLLIVSVIFQEAYNLPIPFPFIPVGPIWWIIDLFFRMDKLTAKANEKIAGRIIWEMKLQKGGYRA